MVNDKKLREMIREEIESYTRKGLKIGDRTIYITPDYIDMDNNRIKKAGTITFGSLEDTNLYRDVANTLRTDDNMYVGGVLTTSGLFTSTISTSDLTTSAISPTSFTEKGASYIIRKSGSTYEAINGATGMVDYSGTIAHSIIQNILDTVDPAGRVVVIGDIQLTSACTITSRMNYEHYGVATLQGADPYLVINHQDTDPSRLRIYVSAINGVDKSKDGIKIINVSGGGGSEIDVTKLTNCDNGILFSGDGGSLSRYNDVTIKGGIFSNNTAIRIEGDNGSGEPFGEGITFNGRIFACDNGIYIPSGTTKYGAFTMYGVIDNADNANSYDFIDLGSQGIPHLCYCTYIRPKRMISLTFMNYYNANKVPFRELLYPFFTNGMTETTIGVGGGDVIYQSPRAILYTTSSDGDGIQMRPSQVLRNDNVMFRYHTKVSRVNSGSQTIRVGLADNVTSFVNSDTINGIQVKYDSSWKIIHGDGTLTSTVDTSLTTNEFTAIFEISNNHVSVYSWSGNLYAGSTVNLPDTQLLFPFYNIITGEAAGKTLNVQQSPSFEDITGL